jgi:hypothetical protein
VVVVVVVSGVKEKERPGGERPFIVRAGSSKRAKAARALAKTQNERLLSSESRVFAAGTR